MDIHHFPGHELRGERVDVNDVTGYLHNKRPTGRGNVGLDAIFAAGCSISACGSAVSGDVHMEAGVPDLGLAVAPFVGGTA